MIRSKELVMSYPYKEGEMKDVFHSACKRVWVDHKLEEGDRSLGWGHKEGFVKSSQRGAGVNTNPFRRLWEDSHQWNCHSAELQLSAERNGVSRDSSLPSFATGTHTHRDYVTAFSKTAFSTKRERAGFPFTLPSNSN